MIAAALLLALVQPADFQDLPLPASAPRSEEERLAAVGYSPAAMKIIRKAPAVAERNYDEELAEYLRLRGEVDQGRISAEQLQQSLDAKLGERNLEWARRDDNILRQLRREDRLLYLNQMRRLMPPPPLLSPAPPSVAYAPEQLAAFRKERIERTAGDEAQFLRLSEKDRLDFLIGLRSSPR